jgi:drug/metabolite transporter (DMT)-like permease
MQRQQHVAAGLKVLSGLFFVVSAAQIKHLSTDYALGQLMFFRLAASIPIFLACSWWLGTLSRDLKPTRPSLHVGRAVLGMLSMAANLLAYVHLPVIEAQAITFLTPVILLIASGTGLGERTSAIGWVAVFVGLLGVWLMMRATPFVSASWADSLGITAGLAAVIFAASSMILIRSLTKFDTALSIAITSATIGSVVTLGFAIAQWRNPSWYQALQLMSLGVVGGLAQLCFVASLARAPPAFLGPFEYVSIVWAVLAGVFFFAEWPAPVEWLGVVLIALSSYAAMRTTYKSSSTNVGCRRGRRP